MWHITPRCKCYEVKNNWDDNLVKTVGRQLKNYYFTWKLRNFKICILVRNNTGRISSTTNTIYNHMGKNPDESRTM